MKRKFTVDHFEITIDGNYLFIFDAAAWINPPLAVTVEQLKEIILLVEREKT